MQTVTRQSLTADSAPSVATWEVKCLKSSPVFNTLICGASPPDLQRELYDPLHPSWGALVTGPLRLPPKHNLLDQPLVPVDFFKFNSLSQIECYCNKLLFVWTMFGAMEMAWLYSVATNIVKVSIEKQQHTLTNQVTLHLHYSHIHYSISPW